MRTQKTAPKIAIHHVLILDLKTLLMVSLLMAGEFKCPKQGRIQDFFLGGGALVSSSTSTPIKHIVFFFAEYQLY